MKALRRVLRFLFCFTSLSLFNMGVGPISKYWFEVTVGPWAVVLFGMMVLIAIGVVYAAVLAIATWWYWKRSAYWWAHSLPSFSWESLGSEREPPITRYVRLPAQRPPRESLWRLVLQICLFSAGASIFSFSVIQATISSPAWLALIVVNVPLALITVALDKLTQRARAESAAANARETALEASCDRTVRGSWWSP